MAIYIGIDPGVNTGLAIWDSSKRQFVRVETTSIIRAIFIVWAGTSPESVKDTTIIFEDARQRKWIPREKDLSQFKGRAMGAGSVMRDCAIWEEFCKQYGIRYEAIAPRKGLTKWNAESFAAVTGWKGRTSNHARDAAMLVFGK